jgi:hypothetical protein
VTEQAQRRVMVGTCCALGAALLAGCASSSKSAAQAQGSSPIVSASLPAGPMIRPPDGPCVVPTASDIALLATASDLVERVTIVVRHATVLNLATRSAGPTDWSTPFASVSVIGRKGGPTLATATATAMNDFTVDDPMTISPPGEYVLFLTRDPDGTYYTTNGLHGMIRLNGGSASVQCGNFDDPAHPLQATGSLSVSALLAMIPATLPAQPTNSKPTVSSASAASTT